MKRLLVCMVVWATGLAAVSAMPPVRDAHALHGAPRPVTGKMQQALPLLREGDIIFISVHHLFYRRIAETSRSWESHVGILFHNSSGGWSVAQSTVPIAKITSLETFLRRSENGRFLVRRWRGGLTHDQVQRLRAAAERRMGMLYDPGFRYDSPRIYCSKFIYDVFIEATGHPVGRLETFREVFDENPGAPLGFWRAWFLGRIPWDRRCVTTTSQLHSPSLFTVYDSEKRAH
jgi:hypothetical protein